MQLQPTFPESKFPREYTDAIFIRIDRSTVEKVIAKIQRVPILRNTVYMRLLVALHAQ